MLAWWSKTVISSFLSRMSLSCQQNNVAKYNLIGSYFLLGLELHCSMLSRILVFLMDLMLFWWVCLCRWPQFYSSQLWVLFVLAFRIAIPHKEALWTCLFRVLSASCIWMAICFSRLRKRSAFISLTRVLRCSVFILNSFYAILGLASHSYPWVLRCFGYECLFFPYWGLNVALPLPCPPSLMSFLLLGQVGWWCFPLCFGFFNFNFYFITVIVCVARVCSWVWGFLCHSEDVKVRNSEPSSLLPYREGRN